MKKNTISILYIVFFLVGLHQVFAESSVVINEFLIDPTPQTVELFNKGSEPIDISGWFIDDNGGLTYYTIPQSSVLYPNACMIFSGDFNLNKSSNDVVRLFDSSTPPISTSARLIDSFSYKSSSGSGIVFYRLPDGTSYWTTGSATIGKYNTTGLSCVITPTPNPSPTDSIAPSPEPTISPTPIPIPTPTSPLVSYTHIFISEVMTYPNTSDNEWIELYNDNPFPISLDNWYIDDIENSGSPPRQFSLIIEAKQYKTVDLSSSIFNNDKDSARLLDFNKHLKDSFEYGENRQGKSLGRTSFDNDTFCPQEPSKDIKNNDCINFPTPTMTQTITFAATPSPTSSLFLSTIRLTSSSAPINRLAEARDTAKNTDSISGSSENDYGQVLGTNTAFDKSVHAIKYSSFLSISYSLLTIVSLFIKMKNNNGKNRKLISPSFHPEK